MLWHERKEPFNTSARGVEQKRTGEILLVGRILGVAQNEVVDQEPKQDILGL